MSHKAYQIALCGWPGSGTTTIAKLLLGRLGSDAGLWKIVSPASKKFRSLAKVKYPELREDEALTLFEQDSVSKFSVDLFCDGELAKIGEEETNFIADARLASKFLPESFKILLLCDEAIRFKRIAEREGVSVETASRQTKAREEASLERYQCLYGIKSLETQCPKFDIVFDSGDMNPEDIVDCILACWYTEMSA